MPADFAYDPDLVGRVLASDDPAALDPQDWNAVRGWLETVRAWDMDPSVYSKPERRQRLRLQKHFANTLRKLGVTSGRVGELGGPFNSFARMMPTFEFQYLSLYPVAGRSDVLVADITQCDYLEPEQFDVIFSVSVLEHVAKPWLAAEQMVRLLKPGGIMFHSAPFSYFYHGAPADFWRYTPDAMRLLFSALEPISAEFNGLNRRRDNRGSPANPVDKDGGPAFGVDSFGGWRENWSTVYVGRKNAAWLEAQMVRQQKQLAMNLIKYLTKHGMEPEAAAQRVCERMQTLNVNRDGEVILTDEAGGLTFTPEEVLAIFGGRGRARIKPSYAMFVQARRAGF
jgi:SAM-dependent methyltransferase